MPISDSYHDYLISRLKEPSYAALYLETHFELDEGEEIDPKLLRLALRHIVEALGEQKMTPEEVKQHYEKLDELLSQKGSYVIYYLGDWLKQLGLKLTVSVEQQTQESLENSPQPEEVLV
jgi:DNA-binding phage protein